jgi:putative transposase
MRKSRFNDSQRQYILDIYLKGTKTVDALCEEHQISPATFYKWKNEVETDKNEDKKRLKEQEAENLRLKKMYAELQLKHEVVSEAVEILKKMKAADRKRRI